MEFGLEMVRRKQFVRAIMIKYLSWGTVQELFRTTHSSVYFFRAFSLQGTTKWERTWTPAPEEYGDTAMSSSLSVRNNVIYVVSNGMADKLFDLRGRSLPIQGEEFRGAKLVIGAAGEIYVSSQYKPYLEKYDRMRPLQKSRNSYKYGFCYASNRLETKMLVVYIIDNYLHKMAFATVSG